jgi:hypothetical protein
MGLKAFNPSQPRVPAGNPDGGRWKNGDASGGNDPRVPTDAAPNNSSRLGAQYAQGETQKDRFLNSHIVDNHIGKTDDELKERIRREQIRGLFVSTGRDRNGSFESEDSARDLIKQTLENNSAVVSRVASGLSREEFLTWRFGYVTGREAVMDPPGSEIRIRNTYNVGVAIVHDPTSESRFRVITAFPRNFNPRIGR